MICEKPSRDVFRSLEKWGVPTRIRQTLSCAKKTDAVKAVDAWIKLPKEKWCLVLCADKGLGKSTAAGWWLARKAETDPWRQAPGLVGTSNIWWPACEISALDFYGDDFKRICVRHSLVIDDIGTEFNDAKGAFAAKLDRLLDSRYREYRKTIITTNLTGKAMSERYDSRVIDRIREGAVWQTISGESMRRSNG